MMTEQSTEPQSWQPAQEIAPRIIENWGLTPRETEVLGTWLLDSSPTYRRVARALKISVNTVKIHLDHLRQKARQAGYPDIMDTDDMMRRYLAEEQSLPPVEPPLPTD